MRPHSCLAQNRRLAGAEGFEPSNTGSKVPRLTAWPRPTVHTARRGPFPLAPCFEKNPRPNLARIWHLSAELEEANLRTGRITQRERQVYPMASFGGKSLKG